MGGEFVGRADHDPALVEKARHICAKLNPNKDYQFLRGFRDNCPPMTEVIAALSTIQPARGEPVAEIIPHDGGPDDVIGYYEGFGDE